MTPAVAPAAADSDARDAALVSKLEAVMDKKCKSLETTLSDKLDRQTEKIDAQTALLHEMLDFLKGEEKPKKKTGSPVTATRSMKKL